MERGRVVAMRPVNKRGMAIEVVGERGGGSAVGYPWGRERTREIARKSERGEGAKERKRVKDHI
jgi:hypothetical protein